MKKRILTMLLVVAMICTVFSSNAFARTENFNGGSYYATAVLNFSSTRNGAYATTSYRIAADRVYAWVKYRGIYEGNILFDSQSNLANNAQSIAVNITMPSTTPVYAESEHNVIYNNATYSHAMTIYA